MKTPRVRVVEAVQTEWARPPTLCDARGSVTCPLIRQSVYWLRLEAFCGDPHKVTPGDVRKQQV